MSYVEPYEWNHTRSSVLRQISASRTKDHQNIDDRALYAVHFKASFCREIPCKRSKDSALTDHIRLNPGRDHRGSSTLDAPHLTDLLAPFRQYITAEPPVRADRCWQGVRRELKPSALPHLPFQLTQAHLCGSQWGQTRQPFLHSGPKILQRPVVWRHRTMFERRIRPCFPDLY